ncbi:MAG: 50S ribosomal protein L25/general stress protein Ctc [Actinomycetota bacterium]|nr:50S ribosomal protein L25/general stress protein Ctc [Actinomycetota bacterium]
MAEVTLKAVKREKTGKGAARQARAANRVPGVIYGQGMDPIAVEVDRRELVTAFHTDAGMNVLLTIEVDGQSTTALARDLQRDPLRGTLLHADFVKVDLKQEVEVEVPVHIVGEAPGVKEGGVLEQPLFELHVRCLPTEVPESIEADVSGLNVGDSLKVADLSSGRTFEILNDPEASVAAVVAAVTEEELEAMEAAATADVEVPAEGDTAAEESPAAEGEGEDGTGSADAGEAESA